MHRLIAAYLLCRVGPSSDLTNPEKDQEDKLHSVYQEEVEQLLLSELPRHRWE